MLCGQLVPVREGAVPQPLDSQLVKNRPPEERNDRRREQGRGQDEEPSHSHGPDMISGAYHGKERAEPWRDAFDDPSS